MVIGVYISARVILPAPDIFERAREAEETVEKLAPRGGKSILSDCRMPSGSSTLCIRTEEHGDTSLWGGSGETYRRIYGY